MEPPTKQMQQPSEVEREQENVGRIDVLCKVIKGV